MFSCGPETSLAHPRQNCAYLWRCLLLEVELLDINVLVWTRDISCAPETGFCLFVEVLTYGSGKIGYDVLVWTQDIIFAYFEGYFGN